MLATLERLAPVAAPNAATDVPARRSESLAQSPQRPAPEPSSPAPQPGTERERGTTPNVPSLVMATPGADAAVVPGHVVHTQVPSAPDPAPKPSGVTAETSQSPWSAAAAGGVAIGTKSKQAAVATAGFFTRVARKVAGSF
jgi:hypothetical protein